MHLFQGEEDDSRDAFIEGDITDDRMIVRGFTHGERTPNGSRLNAAN